ncbi:hypothetical protein KYY02_31265 [Streptomyces pimonensis]|uniref:Uncharacterized protein n=1 Tax=Streptomyces pimonensis TaxID=2860288 RepID=A0ABV4J9Y8_9ACTN
MTAPEPEPARDWVEGLAHERLVDATRFHLQAAERAAAAAEAATVQAGHVRLARYLAGHPEPGR